MDNKFELKVLSTRSFRVNGIVYYIDPNAPDIPNMDQRKYYVGVSRNNPAKIQTVKGSVLRKAYMVALKAGKIIKEANIDATLKANEAW